jgi:hypothetical protein
MNYSPYLIGAALLLASPALAGPQDDVLKAFGECASVSDGAARLACYDALAPRMKAALVPIEQPAPPVAANTSAPVAPASTGEIAAPAPPVAAASAPPVAAATPAEQESWFGRNVGSVFDAAPEQQTTPEKFGADQMPQPEPAQSSAPQEIDSISAQVSDVAFTAFGKFIVILDNGQIWRQIEGDSDVAHFKKNPADNQVTISRGAIGSYDLTINGGEKVFKVKRVK